MSKIHQLLDRYGESHQNPTNKTFHWFCIPAIMFSLTGILMSIPFLTTKTMWLNWPALIFAIALIYYLRLSITLAIGFAGIIFLLLWGNWEIYMATYGDDILLFIISLGIFVIAWIGQFIGHKIEGKKPSFLEDVQFLLIGPAWLLHFIYKKLGIPLV